MQAGMPVFLKLFLFGHVCPRPKALKTSGVIYCEIDLT